MHPHIFGQVPEASCAYVHASLHLIAMGRELQFGFSEPFLAADDMQNRDILLPDSVTLTHGLP
jgi:hypothetical protein